MSFTTTPLKKPMYATSTSPSPSSSSVSSKDFIDYLVNTISILDNSIATLENFRCRMSPPEIVPADKNCVSAMPDCKSSYNSTFYGMWDKLPIILIDYSDRIDEFNTFINDAVFHNTKGNPECITEGKSVNEDKVQQCYKALSILDKSVFNLRRLPEKLKNAPCDESQKKESAGSSSFHELWRMIPDTLAEYSKDICEVGKDLEYMFFHVETSSSS